MRVAIYSRYSTDKQSVESIADQERVCTEYARRAGWPKPERFSDEGISGGALGNRPGLKRAMEYCEEGDVLLAMDLTRLSRSQDLSPLIERLRFRRVRVVGVQDNFDSDSEVSRLQSGMSGMMSAELRRGIAKRTRSALQMRAGVGRAAGGKAFGYDSVVRGDGTKWYCVNEAQARVVRWIFEQYASGKSPRAIAAELNARKVSSPGSTWAGRKSRRKSGWLQSAINCSLLRNTLYRGEMIWGKTESAKNPDTGKRVVVRQCPESEWKRFKDPSLRIVPDHLWQLVQTRLSSRRGDSVPTKYTRRGKAVTSSAGRRVKYALSGLLRCAECGANYAMADRRMYACSSFLNGGTAACLNTERVNRVRFEQQLANAIEKHLLTPERMARFKKRVAERINDLQSARATDAAARGKALRDAETKVANLLNAIEAGILTSSTKSRLVEAEAARDALLVDAPVESGARLARLLPGAIERYRAMVAELPGMISRDPDRAREILLRMLGEVQLVRKAGGLVYRFSAAPARLLKLDAFCVGSGGRI
jgi:site-specific DNA recombinase